MYDNTLFSENLEKISNSVVEVISFPLSQDISLPSVALYVDRNNEEWNAGTGFSIKEGGYFLTAYHIIKDSKKVRIVTDDNVEHNATIVATDKNLDLAIIKVYDVSLPPLNITEKEIQKRGLKIAFVGYPLGQPIKFTHEGIVSSIAFVGNFPVYGINAFVNHGNSGGPVFLSESKEVIGIVSMRDPLFKPPPPIIALSENEIKNLDEQGKKLLKNQIFMYENTAKAISDNAQAGIGIAIRLNKNQIEKLLAEAIQSNP